MKYLFVAFFCFMGLVAHCQNVCEFFKIPMAQLYASLGGINVSSLCNSPLDVDFNPAIIVESPKYDVSASYTCFRGHINMCSAGYCRCENPLWGYAFTIKNIGYGQMDGYNQDGEFEKKFSAQDLAMGGCVSRKLFDNLYSGVSVNLIYSKNDDLSAIGLAFSAGLLYYKGGFSAGVSCYGMGVLFKKYISGNDEKLPVTVQIGVSKELEHAPMRFSLTYVDIQKWYVAGDGDVGFGELLVDHLIVSTELFHDKPFSLQFGFNFLRHNELKLSGASAFPGGSMGFSVNLKKFSLGYSHYFMANGVELRFKI